MPDSRASPLIAMRASPERKAGLAALAAARGMSQSALLGLLVDHVLGSNPVPPAPREPPARPASGGRLTVRLRPGDRARLEVRAAARGLRPCSYLAALVHAHLRASPPLPAAEIDVLQAAVAGLSATGRRLDRLARLAGDGGTAPAGVAADLHDTRLCVDELRRAVGVLVGASLRSWEAGDA